MYTQYTQKYIFYNNMVNHDINIMLSFMNYNIINL